MNGPLIVYMKASNHCAIGCTHCYLSEAVRADRTLMSRETLAATASMLADLADRQRNNGIHIIWHGGEPMNVPVRWYWEAAALLDEILPGHTESIQTSLLPYRAEFAPLIKQRFSGEIGSSIDFGQRALNGSEKAYQDLWLLKVEQARDAGLRIIPGMVPSRKVMGRAPQITQWFVQHGFPIFNVERYNNFHGEDPLRPTNAEHAIFLTELFQTVMSYEQDAPRVGVIHAALHGVLHGISGDRWGGRCQTDFLVVEPDGRLNSCPDRSAHEQAFSFAQEGAAAFQESPARRRWIRVQAITHRESHCAGCENAAWCKSGCPITPNGTPHGETECAGYRSFLRVVRAYCQKPEGLARAQAYLAQEAL